MWVLSSIWVVWPDKSIELWQNRLCQIVHVTIASWTLHVVCLTTAVSLTLVHFMQMLLLVTKFETGALDDPKGPWKIQSHRYMSCKHPLSFTTISHFQDTYIVYFIFPFTTMIKFKLFFSFLALLDFSAELLSWRKRPSSVRSPAPRPSGNSGVHGSRPNFVGRPIPTISPDHF